ncbi:TRAP transporter substrate-binding protein DctP [Dehalococcoidia bacterium]|nr:TRAP transporter substrate-binding protein DctP [Dehalococcoidia bacterium]
MKKKLVLIPLALLLATSIVAIGCPPEEVEQPVPVVPEPVVFEWTMQADVGPGEPIFIYTKEWIQDIYVASGGRLQITLHPAGAIVGFMDVFGAVAEGTIDLANTWGPYWVGYDPVFGMFCGSAMGMTPEETWLWLYEWGGLELKQQKFAQYNMHVLPCTTFKPAELFLWAHRPIRTFEDLEGLTVRAAGLSMEMFAELGISAFWMPGGETPPALLKGVVDAAEFTTLPGDMRIGFHEAASYVMIGPRATVIARNIIINADRWNELPPDLKQIVESTTYKSHFLSLYGLRMLEKEYLAKAKEFGITFVHVEDCLANLMREAYDRLLAADAAECPFFAQVWESQKAFLDEYRRFAELMWPWE